MIRFTAEALLAKHVQPDQLVTTLERQMRCGVGKCGHCYIGGKLVCNDGPVFTWQQLQEMGAQP
jgi:NAD(P)H-flavin reductase